MGIVRIPTQLGSAGDVNGVASFASESVRAIIKEINGRLDVNKNLNCALVSATFLVANKDLSIKHNLGRTPQGFFVHQLGGGYHVFNGSAAWTSSLIYLQCSSIGWAKVTVF